MKVKFGIRVGLDGEELIREVEDVDEIKYTGEEWITFVSKDKQIVFRKDLIDWIEKSKME
jgi:hypothetical protein